MECCNLCNIQIFKIINATFKLDVQNWTAYRQALRDLPITARPTLDEDGNLVNIEWPTLPTSTP